MQQLWMTVRCEWQNRTHDYRHRVLMINNTVLSILMTNIYQYKNIKTYLIAFEYIQWQI